MPIVDNTKNNLQGSIVQIVDNTKNNLQDNVANVVDAVQENIKTRQTELNIYKKKHDLNQEVALVVDAVQENLKSKVDETQTLYYNQYYDNLNDTDIVVIPDIDDREFISYIKSPSVQNLYIVNTKNNLIDSVSKTINTVKENLNDHKNNLESKITEQNEKDKVDDLNSRIDNFEQFEEDNIYYDPFYEDDGEKYVKNMLDIMLYPGIIDNIKTKLIDNTRDITIRTNDLLKSSINDTINKTNSIVTSAISDTIDSVNTSIQTNTVSVIDQVNKNLQSNVIEIIDKSKKELTISYYITLLTCKFKVKPEYNKCDNLDENIKCIAINYEEKLHDEYFNIDDIDIIEDYSSIIKYARDILDKFEKLKGMDLKKMVNEVDKKIHETILKAGRAAKVAETAKKAAAEKANDAKKAEREATNKAKEERRAIKDAQKAAKAAERAATLGPATEQKNDAADRAEEAKKAVEERVAAEEAVEVAAEAEAEAKADADQAVEKAKKAEANAAKAKAAEEAEKAEEVANVAKAAREDDVKAAREDEVKAVEAMEAKERDVAVGVWVAYGKRAGDRVMAEEVANVAKAKETVKAASNQTIIATADEKTAKEEAVVAKTKAREYIDEAVVNAYAVKQALKKVNDEQEALKKVNDEQDMKGGGVIENLKIMNIKRKEKGKKVERKFNIMLRGANEKNYNVIDALYILKKKIKQFIPNIEKIQNEKLDENFKEFLKRCDKIRKLNLTERNNLNSMILSITDNKIKIIAIAGYILPSEIPGNELLNQVFKMIKEESPQSFMDIENKFNNNLKIIKRHQEFINIKIKPGKWGDEDVLKELLKKLYNIKFKIDGVKTNNDSVNISQCSIIINDYQLLHKNSLNIKNWFTSNNKIILNNNSSLYDIHIIDKKLAKKYNIKVSELTKYDDDINNFGVYCTKKIENSDVKNGGAVAMVGGTSDVEKAADNLRTGVVNTVTTVKTAVEKASEAVRKLSTDNAKDKKATVYNVSEIETNINNLKNNSKEVITKVKDNLEHHVNIIKQKTDICNLNNKIDTIINLLHNDSIFTDKFNNNITLNNDFIKKYIKIYRQSIAEKKNLTFEELINQIKSN